MFGASLHYLRIYQVRRKLRSELTNHGLIIPPITTRVLVFSQTPIAFRVIYHRPTALQRHKRRKSDLLIDYHKQAPSKRCDYRRGGTDDYKSLPCTPAYFTDHYRSDPAQGTHPGHYTLNTSKCANSNNSLRPAQETANLLPHSARCKARQGGYTETLPVNA